MATYGELGRTGLNRYGEWVSEEFLPALQGQKAIRVYREIRDNDPIVGAFFFAIEMLIRNVPWDVTPVDESQEAIEAAEFVEECRNDLDHTWPDLLAEMLSMLQYGWSYHEIVYKPRRGGEVSKHDDGKIGWKKFPIRSQDTLNGWVFNESKQELMGMRQLAPPDFKDTVIPMSKALLFRTTSHKDNPEGRSILRNAYRPWYFKKRMEEIEGIGVERDLAGLPVAYVDEKILRDDATPSEVLMREALLRLVQNIRRDRQEGVLFPNAFDKEGNKLYELELLSTGGSRQLNTNEIISRYDQRIAMTVLADFILLGTQNVGSWALSEGKTNLFGMAINAWLESFAETFNKFAIPKLLKINKMDPTLAPKLSSGEVQPPDLTALGDLIAKLAGAGMPLFPDEELESAVRKIAHLPEKSEEAKDLQDTQGMLAMQQAEAQNQMLGAQGAGAAAGAHDKIEGAAERQKQRELQQEGQQFDQGMQTRQADAGDQDRQFGQRQTKRDFGLKERDTKDRMGLERDKLKHTERSTDRQMTLAERQAQVAEEEGKGKLGLEERKVDVGEKQADRQLTLQERQAQASQKEGEKKLDLEERKVDVGEKTTDRQLSLQEKLANTPKKAAKKATKKTAKKKSAKKKP